MSGNDPNRSPAPDERDTASMLARLLELRSRAVKAVLILIVAFVALLPFSDEIWQIVSEPLTAQLPPNAEMLAKDIASPFMTPFKTTLWAALFLTMPILLYQLRGAVAPWLPPKGRRATLPFLAASASLFYAGIALAYFFVLPLAFHFFVNYAPANVVVQTDIRQYLDFTIAMLFAFGLAFQMPIAIVIVVWTRLVPRRALEGARPYVLLGAFVIGMLLTPPDVLSQTLLAIPLYLLFEGALFFCRRFLPEEPA